MSVIPFITLLDIRELLFLFRPKFSENISPALIGSGLYSKFSPGRAVRLQLP